MMRFDTVNSAGKKASSEGRGSGRGTGAVKGERE
jgi:hypothetical protein